MNIWKCLDQTCNDWLLLSALPHPLPSALTPHFTLSRKTSRVRHSFSITFYFDCLFIYVSFPIAWKLLESREHRSGGLSLYTQHLAQRLALWWDPVNAGHCIFAVLVYLGCQDEVPQTRGLKPQTSIFSQFSWLEIQGQGVSRVGFFWTFSLCLHMVSHRVSLFPNLLL